MRKLRIKGSHVLITGAGSGIGRATALRCARGGAWVSATDIDLASAEATADSCSEVGPEARAYALDVTDAGAFESLATKVEDERGPVHVLVNNAGVGIYGPFCESPLSDWEWLRQINLDGVVHGCHAFGTRMTERREGHVVNVASGAAYIPNRNMAAYCASKAAVVMLTQCLRADWASSGVGASVVCPGVIDTPIAAATRMGPATEAKRDAAVSALGRGHSPDVVAKAIVSAVEQNRELVPAGLESAVAFHLMRLAPGPLRGIVAKANLP